MKTISSYYSMNQGIGYFSSLSKSYPYRYNKYCSFKVSIYESANIQKDKHISQTIENWYGTEYFAENKANSIRNKIIDQMLQVVLRLQKKT